MIIQFKRSAGILLFAKIKSIFIAKNNESTRQIKFDTIRCAKMTLQQYNQAQAHAQRSIQYTHGRTIRGP